MLTQKQIRAIRRGHAFEGIYLVFVSEREGELLEIYSALRYPYKHFRKNKRTVVGIAQGYDEALNLVKTIIEDVYNSTGGFKLKDYLVR